MEWSGDKIMGLPAYYTETAPSGLVTLPVSWDPLSNPYATTRDQIKIQTGRGVTFEYELFTQDSPTFIFTIPASQLADFRAMYDAVVGSAFFFIPDSGSPGEPLHVRIKDPAGFSPEPVGVFFWEGIPEQFFRYELRLIAEIIAAEILD